MSNELSTTPTVISRCSQLSGNIHTRTLEVNPEMFRRYTEKRDILIQDAFPNLTPGEREFIKTGITEEEWEETFG